MLKKRLSPDEIKKKALSTTENKFLAGANDISFLGEMFSQKKMGNNKETIRKPTGSNKEAIGKPLVNTIDEGKRPLVNTIGKQKESIGNPLVNKNPIKYISGNEEKILNFLFQLCLNSGSRETPKIGLELLTRTLEISSHSVTKTTTQRLVKKGFLIRNGGKRGNGGFAFFEFPSEIYHSLLVRKETISKPLVNPLVNDRVTHRETSPSSSSSISIINKTTTEDAWSKIDITPLEPYEFTNTHIKQIIDSNKSTPALLQKSIEYFVYMMENKIGDIKTPIPFFMSIMRNAGAIAKPLGYKSQLEKNLEALEKEEKEQKEKAKTFVTNHYERIIKTPVIQQEKKNLLKDNSGFLREDSKAFMESLKGIMIQKIETGELL